MLILSIGDNMCGIVGLIDKNSKNTKKKIIKNMADKIIHRGPDAEGYFVDDYIALGHRRLSIIDLKGGNQPLYNETKDIALIFRSISVYLLVIVAFLYYIIFHYKKRKKAPKGS